MLWNSEKVIFTEGLKRTYTIVTLVPQHKGLVQPCNKAMWLACLTTTQYKILSNLQKAGVKEIHPDVVFVPKPFPSGHFIPHKHFSNKQ